MDLVVWNFKMENKYLVIGEIVKVMLNCKLKQYFYIYIKVTISF